MEKERRSSRSRPPVDPRSRSGARAQGAQNALRTSDRGRLGLAIAVDRELERTHSREVLHALSTISLGLVFLFSLLLVLHRFEDLEPAALTGLSLIDLASGGLFLGLRFLLSRQRIPSRFAHLLAFLIVAQLLAVVLAVVSLTGEAAYLGYLPILVICCGAVMLSLPWLLASIGLVLTGRVLAMRILVDGDLLPLAAPLVAALVIAVILLRTRTNARKRTATAQARALEETTRRQVTEESLKESETRLELAISGARGSWWDIELDQERGDLLFARVGSSAKLDSFLGLKMATDSGDDWRNHVLPEDREIYLEALEAHVSGEAPTFDVEYRARDKEAEIRWLRSRGRILLDDQGVPVRCSGIDLDITDSKHTSRQLSLFKRAVEQSPSLMLVTDREGAIEYVNPTFSRVTGYGLDEVLGKTPSLLKSDSTPETVHQELWETITAGAEWRGEIRNTRKDGTEFWVSSSICPIFDEKGQIRHYLAVQEDITQHKKVEARLAQTRNLESLGQLVAGVAHDFNNLLTAVFGFTDIALHQVSDGDPVHESLVEIRKAGESASELTGQLLAFSRRQTLETRLINLNTIVTESRELLGRAIREDIELDIALAADLGATEVDPSQIRQVLLNLAVNARDAMESGGRLTIETENVELDGQVANGAVTPEPGPYVLLTVSDNGEGMDEETQRRVFEPFFTTKARGRGTGLGLASVYGVVKQSGGFIGLYSEVGVGSSFKIYLPQAEGEVEVLRSQAPIEIRGGSETILVVEDDAAVRDVATRALKCRGYKVLACTEAEEAERVFAENEVDVLLTDMVMPGTNGVDLASSLRSRQPSLRVLLMSGYTEKSLADFEALRDQAVFLQKPFRLDDLLAKVRECLEG